MKILFQIIEKNKQVIVNGYYGKMRCIMTKSTRTYCYTIEL